MVEDGIYDEVHMGFMVAYGEFLVNLCGFILVLTSGRANKPKKLITHNSSIEICCMIQKCFDFMWFCFLLDDLLDDWICFCFFGGVWVTLHEDFSRYSVAILGFLLQFSRYSVAILCSVAILDLGGSWIWVTTVRILAFLLTPLGSLGFVGGYLVLLGGKKGRNGGYPPVSERTWLAGKLPVCRWFCQL